MFDISNLLVVGERQLGWYTIEMVRQARHGWELGVLPMNAVITNYRLIIKPLPKKYPPASIPRNYIQHIDKARIADRFTTICIVLTTGKALYMVLSSGNMDYMLEDLQTMKTPPPRFGFDDNIPPQQIERLIRFFTQGIPPNEP